MLTMLTMPGQEFVPCQHAEHIFVFLLVLVLFVSWTGLPTIRPLARGECLEQESPQSTVGESRTGMSSHAWCTSGILASLLLRDRLSVYRPISTGLAIASDWNQDPEPNEHGGGCSYHHT
jgi:hypothetical protein